MMLFNLVCYCQAVRRGRIQVPHVLSLLSLDRSWPVRYNLYSVGRQRNDTPGPIMMTRPRGSPAWPGQSFLPVFEAILSEYWLQTGYTPCPRKPVHLVSFGWLYAVISAKYAQLVCLKDWFLLHFHHLSINFPDLNTTSSPFALFDRNLVRHFFEKTRWNSSQFYCIALELNQWSR